jgi:hypothetical protein
MLGGGHGVSSGSIDNQTAILSSSVKIHIVDSDAGPSDDLEPAAGGFKDLARDLGATPHDERVAERDLGAQLLVREIVRAVNVG